MKICAIFLLILVGVSFSFAHQSSQDSPVVERAIKPAYPPIAAAKRVSGTVIIDVEIESDGSVRKATVKNGPALLRKTAREAALRWVFNSAESSGRARVAQLVFIFHPVDYVPKQDEADFKRPYQMSVRWEATAGETRKG